MQAFQSFYATTLRDPYQAACREWREAWMDVDGRQRRVTVIDRITHLAKALLLVIPVINIIAHRIFTSCAETRGSTEPEFRGLDQARVIQRCLFPALPENAVRIWPSRLRPRTSRADAFIGLRASCLLHFGTPATRYTFQQPPGGAVVRVSDNGRGGEFVLSFTDGDYAQRLQRALTAIGLQVSCHTVEVAPNVIGPECYRAEVRFGQETDFLYFSRELCGLEFHHVERFVQEKRTELGTRSPRILDRLSHANVRYILNAPPYSTFSFRSIRGHHLAAPPKIWGETVAASVGAMSSLLIPGYNSLMEARQGHGHARVTLDAARGFCIHFPDGQDENGRTHRFGQIQATRTHEGLQEMGFAFSLGLRPRGAISQETSGMIQSRQPAEIVRFLIGVCKQTREEVRRFVGEFHLQETDFGQALIRESELRIEGEGDHVRIVMETGRTFDESQLTLNPQRMRVAAIPDLPAEARGLRLNTELRTQLQAAIDGIMSSGLNDGHSRAQLQTGIENIITVLSGAYFSGVPSDPVERAAFVQKLDFYLRHVVYLLRFVSPEQKQMQLAHLAIGGTACAGRHVQASLDVINNLRVHAPSALYHDAEALGAHLSLADQETIKYLDRTLGGLRKSIVDTMAERYLAQMGGDLSHFKNHIFKRIGPRRGIPCADLVGYRDPYAGTARNLPLDRLLADFDAEYTPAFVLQQLQRSLCYGPNGPGTDVMERVVDFFKLHAPVAYQTEDDQIRFFEEEVLEEDYVSIRRPYLIQLLKITNHFL